MLVADRASRNPSKGRTRPRIAPPTPAVSGVKEFVALASRLGIDLFPWQELAARYLTAVGLKGRWLYREVAIVVARQNGKTTLLVPLIVGRLLAGQKITHAAQTRELPRDIHEQVANLLIEHFPDQIPKRRGIRYGAGQEEIHTVSGGSYDIVAATRGGARGLSNDTLIIDELREITDHSFIGAAKPSILASAKPQLVYVSNAGTDESEVLNAVRARADEDPLLAYLEWSAAPERAVDDRAGWFEANPAIGHKVGLLESLGDEYRAARLGGTLPIFETEYLCRWVTTTRERLVDAYAWMHCQSEGPLAPSRPFMAVSMDPEGTRASVALAWRLADDAVALRLAPVVGNVTGEPIDTDRLGKDIRSLASRMGVVKTGGDPLTDAELLKYIPNTQKVTGQAFAAASANFVAIVNAGKLRWWDADAVTDDLTWTARKYDSMDKGSFEAVRSKDDRPIPASLAAIRAVWLASGPRPVSPRVM